MPSPDHRFPAVGGRYRVNDGLIVGVEGFASEPGEDDCVRAAMAKAADRWYADITRKKSGNGGLYRMWRKSHALSLQTQSIEDKHIR